LIQIILFSDKFLPNQKKKFKKSGCGFQTKQRYRFGWFSMKLKLVGGDSAGVVTAYYVSLIVIFMWASIKIPKFQSKFDKF